MAKKNSKFYKTAFWVVLLIVIILAISLARLMYDYAKGEETDNATAVDIDNLNLTDSDDGSGDTGSDIFVDLPELGAEDGDVEHEVTVQPVEEIDDTLQVVVLTEGETLSFPNIEAEDPDGDELFFTYSEPLDENGEWHTQEGDAGNYEVAITVSDGELKAIEKILVIVEQLNAAPVIDVSDVITVKEGDLVEIDAEVFDPDGDNVDISYSGWMDESTRLTTFDDAGEYTVTITASDGSKSTTAEVLVVVENVNRPPVFKSVI
ncbi:hypothetical protein H6503_05130 [Candidatus Woesearchaeota archaeon]|nr:hypothetical protein [Candidatus Woesearchaeota archaeon]